MGDDPKENPIEQSGAGRPAPESEPHHIANSNPFRQNRDEVIVRRLPERLNSGGGQTFFCQVQELLNATQPRFVFDFSQVSELDAVGIQLLLQCLEEVMKLNGDVKLAAVPPGPAAVLVLTGVDRLFEIFDSPEDAVRSFRCLPKHEWPMQVPLNASQADPVAATAGYGDD